MGFCGLLEGEPTTRLELVTYRLRIKKWYLIINNLQKRCAGVAWTVSFRPVKVHIPPSALDHDLGDFLFQLAFADGGICELSAGA